VGLERLPGARRGVPDSHEKAEIPNWLTQRDDISLFTRDCRNSRRRNCRGGRVIAGGQYGRLDALNCLLGRFFIVDFVRLSGQRDHHQGGILIYSFNFNRIGLIWSQFK
jgi:hypothetical protein